MSESTTDVLVVGAGPTGLMAANELARHGVACRIIDTAPVPPTQSRALAVHARTMETLDLLGVADAVLERGLRVPGIGVRLDGAPSLHLDLLSLPTRFPFVVILPQTETMAVLESRLTASGVSVERGVEWLDFVEQHGWVTSRVRSAGGALSVIHSRYLIAADGAHSPVRHALGLPFVGAADDLVAHLADVTIDGDVDRNRLHIYSGARGFALLVPFRDGTMRVVAIDFADQRAVHTVELGPSDTGALELDELQATIDAIVPMRLTLREPRWITRFGAHHRQVRSYRAGRVFLAGDAAHVHNPAGGQGMNTGLQDACNLAWKLAFVLRGRAPHALLDTYQSERRPVGAHVLRLTERMLRVMLVRGRVMRTVRDLIVRAAFPLGSVRRAMRYTLSGLDIDYRDTVRARRDRTRGLGAHAVQAGDRLPDVRLENARRDAIRLYEVLRAPAYTMCIVASLAKLVRDRRGLLELVRTVNQRCGDAVQIFVVLDTGIPDSMSVGAPPLVDVQREFRTVLGADHGSVLLLRPDGYVAFHRRGFEPKPIMAALASWVSPPVAANGSVSRDALTREPAGAARESAR
ncbi:MAG TPA: FAD-dependent monooxygenase [Gemmatimonadaceae bacterium]